MGTRLRRFDLRTAIACWAVLIVLWDGATATAQPPCDEFAKFISPEEVGNAPLWSAAMDDGVLVLGANTADHLGFEGVGEVYVWEFRDDVWFLAQTLHDFDPTDHDSFGSAMAIEGDTLIVAARDDSVNGVSGAGSVHIFEDIDNHWTQTAYLTADPPTVNGFFGASIAFDGETLLIGSRYHGTDGLQGPGAVFVVERIDGEWRVVQTLTASDGEALDGFGSSVSFAGNHAIIGAPNAWVDNLRWAGAAYVFQRRESGWIEVQRIVAQVPQGHAHCGEYVYATEELLFVNGNVEDRFGLENVGVLYLYRHDGMEWILDRELLDPKPEAEARFGAPIAVSGANVLIGASLSSEGGLHSGKVSWFESNQWTHVADILGSDTTNGDGFGWDLAAHGDLFSVGASGAETDGRDAGGVYLFRFNGACDTAELHRFSVRHGEHRAGNLDSLREDDGDRLVIRSAPGFNGDHRTKVRVDAITSAPTPDAVDVSVVSSITEPGGRIKIHMKNWVTGDIDLLLSDPAGIEETQRDVLNLPGPLYVRDDGRIRSVVTHGVLATFGTSGFRAKLDLVRMDVQYPLE